MLPNPRCAQAWAAHAVLLRRAAEIVANLLLLLPLPLPFLQGYGPERLQSLQALWLRHAVNSAVHSREARRAGPAWRQQDAAEPSGASPDAPHRRRQYQA